MFKILLGAFLGATLFYGCSPQKWCEQHYPSDLRDSVWTEYVCEYDSIKIPYKEVVFDTTFAFLPPTLVYHSWQKQGNLTAKIDIKNGRLNFKCAEDSLLAIVEIQNKIITQKESRVKVKYLPCNLKHHSGWDSFCDYFTSISLFLISVAFILWALSKYLKG